MTRRLLWASLLLVPLSLGARLAGADAFLLFVVAVAALAPLAWVISEATEQAGHHTGPTVGGLLNATVANVPEVMIAMFAVAEGLHEVVRGSLSGSVVGNLLLVLGLALAVGGRGELDQSATRESLALVAIAVPALALAAAPHFWTGDRDSAHAGFVFPVAIGLVLVYGAVVARSLRRRERGERTKEPKWSLPRSLVLLGAATLATAAVAETVTGSIEPFSERLGVSEFFVAAVIVAVAGNAAEHGAAVVIARHGELKLAADVALESAAQVAALVIPAIALASWLIEPLPLAFTVVELVALAAAAAISWGLLYRGVSSRWRGGLLVATYVAVAVAFLLQ